MLVAILPAKYHYQARETINFGNLYADQFHYESDLYPFRVLSLLDYPTSHKIFASQVSVRGYETFDGFSVFYSADDAASWWHNIAKENLTLKNGYGYEFKNWNNRIELTNEDFVRQANDILPYLRLNNVAFIRSLHPLIHPELELVETYDWVTTPGHWSKISKDVEVQPFHLYKIAEPLGRVLVMDKNRAGRTEDGLTLDQLQQARTVSLESYAPSRLEFSVAVEDGQHIYVSTNFHEDWTLTINDKVKNGLVSKTGLGTIAIDPEPGAQSLCAGIQGPFLAQSLPMAFGAFVCSAR